MNPTTTLLDMKDKVYHYPVMSAEVIDALDIKNKKVVVDCTVGIGSHALEFLKEMEEGRLIGIDKDEDSLQLCQQRLLPFHNRCIFVKGNFSQVDKLLKDLNISGADVFFFDLGISTYQLSSAQRGFSFLKEGFLDMRIDKGSMLSAYDLINNLSEKELTQIFREFGEERYARRFARLIVEKRKKEPISTTTQLAHIIMRAIPFRRHHYRIHPATRIFQALRIAVNRELEALAMALPKAISLLKPRGRIAVISFHSLEDRIVKHTFRSFSSQGILRIITKKPLVPQLREKEQNSASRSAKLRVGEKIG